MPVEWTDPSTHVYFTKKEVEAMIKLANDMGIEQGSLAWNVMATKSWMELHQLFNGAKN
jgi:hypothetical protein